jgi:hypothetical protein
MTRARGQLARLVRELPGPAMTALFDVDAIVFDGEQRLADIANFAIGFPEKLESGDAVSAQELRFWAEIAKHARNVRLKPRNAGRPSNMLAHSVANTLARRYFNLTGNQPTLSTVVGKKGEGTVYGPFLDFVREIFKILNIKHAPLSYASPAAYKLRGSGRKK